MAIKLMYLPSTAQVQEMFMQYIFILSLQTPL